MSPFYGVIATVVLAALGGAVAWGKFTAAVTEMRERWRELRDEFNAFKATFGQRVEDLDRYCDRLGDSLGVGPPPARPRRKATRPHGFATNNAAEDDDV